MSETLTQQPVTQDPEGGQPPVGSGAAPAQPDFVPDTTIHAGEPSTRVEDVDQAWVEASFSDKKETEVVNKNKEAAKLGEQYGQGSWLKDKLIDRKTNKLFNERDQARRDADKEANKAADLYNQLKGFKDSSNLEQLSDGEHSPKTELINDTAGKSENQVNEAFEQGLKALTHTNESNRNWRTKDEEGTEAPSTLEAFTFSEKATERIKKAGKGILRVAGFEGRSAKGEIAHQISTAQKARESANAQAQRAAEYYDRMELETVVDPELYDKNREKAEYIARATSNKQLKAADAFEAGLQATVDSANGNWLQKRVAEYRMGHHLKVRDRALASAKKKADRQAARFDRHVQNH